MLVPTINGTDKEYEVSGTINNRTEQAGRSRLGTVISRTLYTRSGILDPLVPVTSRLTSERACKQGLGLRCKNVDSERVEIIDPVQSMQ
jgi:hypothetical protein